MLCWFHMEAANLLIKNMTHTILTQTTSQHNASSATKINFKIYGQTTAQTIYIL
jgi:hypothetical protein